MAKPNIFWQKTQLGSLPPGNTASRETDRWTEELEFGTVLKGAGTSTGIFLGSLTNGSVSDSFEIVVSHDATNEVTNCMFYFSPTTNDRTGGVGFTSTDDAAGAQADFDELLAWGNKQKDFDDGLPTGEEGGIILHPLFSVPTIKSDWALHGNNMKDIASAKPLTDEFYYNGVNSATAPLGTIQPFSDYVSSDAAFLACQLIVPASLEDAGTRQIAITMRLVYTF